MVASNLWIIQETGLCLLTDKYSETDPMNQDETMVGGIISALFSFSKSLDAKIDSVSFGDTVIHYYVNNEIITCLRVTKDTNVIETKDSIKRIHEKFVNSYQEVYSGIGFIKEEDYLPFREIERNILKKNNLIPREITIQVNTEIKSSQNYKITKLIQNIIVEKNPKESIRELKSIFTLINDSEDGNIFRKILMEFDYFIKVLPIAKEDQKKLLNLVKELRSFATIDTWLG